MGSSSNRVVAHHINHLLSGESLIWSTPRIRAMLSEFVLPL